MQKRNSKKELFGCKFIYTKYQKKTDFGTIEVVLSEKAQKCSMWSNLRKDLVSNGDL